MNIPKANFQDQIPKKNGVFSGLEYLSSQNFSNQEMGVHFQPPVMEVGRQQQGLRQDRSSSSGSILSQFESPASAFYATERFMGFQNSDGQIGGSFPCSQYRKSYDLQVPSCQENCCIDLWGQKNNLQSAAKSDFYGSYYNRCFDKSHEGCRVTSSANKFQVSDAASVDSYFPITFQASHDHGVGSNSFSSQFVQLPSSSTQNKQSPRFSYGGVAASPGNPLTSKMRIRWTQDLHEKFVECVNRLGGAEKATPKAILKLMETDGLAIFHVKSHLQKYRIAKFMPDSSEGKSDRRTSPSSSSQIGEKTGLQIKEALKLQLDVQRRLHEQLEIQRNLQLRIEEQGRQLKMMFDHQKKTNSNLPQNQSLNTITIMSQDHEPIFSPEDVNQISIIEGSNDNTQFPSKIS